MSHATAYKAAATSVQHSVEESCAVTRGFIDKGCQLHQELKTLSTLADEIKAIKQALNRFEYFTDQVLSSKS